MWPQGIDVGERLGVQPGMRPSRLVRHQRSCWWLTRFVFQRGRGTVVALNMSDAAREISGLRGSITLATDREREGHQVDGIVTMAPWSGLVVET